MINGTTVPTGRDNTYDNSETHRRSLRGNSGALALTFGPHMKVFDGQAVDIRSPLIFSHQYGWMGDMLFIFDEDAYNNPFDIAWIRSIEEEDTEAFKRVIKISEYYTEATDILPFLEAAYISEPVRVIQLSLGTWDYNLLPNDSCIKYYDGTGGN